jgi:hypothetical protein
MKLFRVAMFLLLLSAAHARAIFIYDFPGIPGSGLAADQTNPQPANATFSDFTRTGVVQAGDPNKFVSSQWNQGSSLDPTQYVGFSITAAAGYHLELTSLTFDAGISLNGPPNAEVAIFVNGSSTPYDTMLFTPPATLPNTPTTFTFNLTPLTAADNATLVEFRFYGWNSTASGERLGFDNVATNGTISNLPEPSNGWAALLPVVIVSCQVWRRLRRFCWVSLQLSRATRLGASLFLFVLQ